MSFAKTKRRRYQQTGIHTERNALYRQIHAAQKKIGLSDDDLRLVLKQHGATLKGGKYSKTTMDIAQLQAVVAQLNKSTYTPTKFVKLTNKQIKLAFRLWNDSYRSGAIKDASFKAFTVWCSRMLKVDLDSAKLNSLSKADCNTLIESLKGWNNDRYTK